MIDTNIVLPSKPKIVKEEGNSGWYMIDGLYPGYGHTLGNSLRRIILSSLPGAAITSIKVEGISHEFSTIEGVREDVIAIILNLKKTRFKLLTDEPQTATISVKGPKTVKASDISLPGQVEILTPDQIIMDVTGKTSVDIEIKIEKGLGYIPKESIAKDRVDIGMIALDAIFTPIRRVTYEVENMRIGDRTDFNRLKVFIETDGTLAPREALERSIYIMIEQLKAVVGFVEPATETPVIEKKREESPREERKEIDPEVLKTRIETFDLSARTVVALNNASIRTVGGLARKKEEDLLDIDGLGNKGIQEIKKALSNFGIVLK